MRYIFVFLFAMLFLSSCEKEDSVIFDLTISPDEISRIELRGDHKTLVPNGVSRMGFHTFVYAKRKMMSHKKDSEGVFYGEEVEEEFLVPSDQLPADYVKVYDGNGKVLEVIIIRQRRMPRGRYCNFTRRVEISRVTG